MDYYYDCIMANIRLRLPDYFHMPHFCRRDNWEPRFVYLIMTLMTLSRYLDTAMGDHFGLAACLYRFMIDWFVESTKHGSTLAIFMWARTRSLAYQILWWYFLGYRRHLSDSRFFSAVRAITIPIISSRRPWLTGLFSRWYILLRQTYTIFFPSNIYIYYFLVILSIS